MVEEIAGFKVYRASELIEPIIQRVKRLDGLYEKIQEAYDELCARNPKSDLLPLVTFDGMFPDPKPSFESKYARLINRRAGACIYLEAHEKFLEDLNLEIANTY